MSNLRLDGYNRSSISQTARVFGNYLSCPDILNMVNVLITGSASNIFQNISPVLVQVNLNLLPTNRSLAVRALTHTTRITHISHTLVFTIVPNNFLYILTTSAWHCSWRADPVKHLLRPLSDHKL